MSNLGDLGIGKLGVIDSFTDEDLSLKLTQLGLIPGSQVKIISAAPLGCPIQIQMNEMVLSLRLKEARTIRISTL